MKLSTDISHIVTFDIH